MKAIESPRWEDFDYETLDSVPGRNRFFWLGDGSTHNEKFMTGNRKYNVLAYEVTLLNEMLNC